MSIFSEIKEQLTARQAAEHYGLKVARNGMACCPFHNDKHPSMKVDSIYHCFGCGAHGDATGYVAQLFGLSQYDAACKIINDFSLPIKPDKSNSKDLQINKQKYAREKKEHERITRIQRRFREWCKTEETNIRKAYEKSRTIIESFDDSTPDEVFGSQEFEIAVKTLPVLEYWLDILCLGTESERIEFFTKGRKEVGCNVARVNSAFERRMGKCRRDPGCGMQQCG